ncbi:unnamed protein product, partial [Brenthis ino]
MADLIRFTTLSGHQNLMFYRVTSGGLSFLVKSDISAIVGLATKLDRDCEYELVIEPFKCSLMTKYGVEVVSSTTNENILSGDEFKKFWIVWQNNTIAFGMGHTVLLKHRSAAKVNQLNYVTFNVSNDRGHVAQWQCYLSPVIENQPLKPIEGGEPHWVQVEDKLPDGALLGGYENEFLYIMRGHLRGSLTPGKFVPSLGLGFISWGGNSHECDMLEILCGYNCTWVPSQDNKVPIGAIEGGHSEVGHEVLYVGRVHYKGHLIVGKVQPSHSCCYFPYGDSELSAREFEVLVVPHRRIHGIIVPIQTDNCA